MANYNTSSFLDSYARIIHEEDLSAGLGPRRRRADPEARVEMTMEELSDRLGVDMGSDENVRSGLLYVAREHPTKLSYVKMTLVNTLGRDRQDEDPATVINRAVRMIEPPTAEEMDKHKEAITQRLLSRNGIMQA